jgi:DNA-binding MarR family transcriptional regulator
MNASLRSIPALDKTIHEPARLLITALLYPLEEADFLYLLNESQLSKGNLSTHLRTLEVAGYVVIEKGYRGKIPRTVLRLTNEGRQAFEQYRKVLKSISKGLPG